jgi:hypothetical protein
MLRAHRQLMTDVMRADQQRGAVSPGHLRGRSRRVLAAAGDGLLLHAQLD